MTSGHQGVLRAIATRPAKRAPMITHVNAVIDAGAGVVGDFGRKPGRAQITIVAAEKWAAACADVGAEVPWTMRRANLLVAGVPVEPKPGSRVVIGTVILEVCSETDPCERMDQQHMGLTRALIPDARGGVRCRVIAGGPVAVGDKVVWEEGALPLNKTAAVM
jgi:MOSC domain-containing protein YiiM